MIKIYGVFLISLISRHNIPLAFFSGKETASKYVELRKKNFPQDETVIEVWCVDDGDILKDIYDHYKSSARSPGTVL